MIVFVYAIYVCKQYHENEVVFIIERQFIYTEDRDSLVLSL